MLNPGLTNQLKSSTGILINPATEDKQDEIITAIQNVKIDTGDIELNTDNLETNQLSGDQKTQVVNSGGSNVDFATETTLNKLTGFSIAPYNEIDYTSGTTTDTYTYKLTGTTVATITVTWSDSTKETLVSIIKT